MKVKYIFLVMLPLLLAVSTLGIYLFEYIIPGNEESAFNTLFSSLWWTIVTITTVGYGDMSPSTVPGQIFTFFLMAAGVIQFSIIVSLVTDQFQAFRSGRDRGLDALKIKNHILICSDDAAWIMEILAQNKEAANVGKIALISPSEEHPLLGTEYNKLEWVHGNGYDLNVLNKACAALSEIAYVYYKDNSYALMTVLQLETMSDGVVVTLAQYIGQEYRKYFEDVGCDHAFDPYELYVPLMIQSFRSQGTPSWVREIIHHSQGHHINTHKLDDQFKHKTWLEYITSVKTKHGIMPIAVIIDDIVMVNPDANFELPSGCSIMEIEPPASRPKGDVENHGVRIEGIDGIGLEGHILISSDNPTFIERMLSEMGNRNLSENVVVISESPLMEDIPKHLKVEWIEGDSNSEKSFRLARATEAKIALIDHFDDGRNLMAVLRLEQETDGEIFTISTYRKQNFDLQLFKVGCDYCLEPEDLVAPILSQSALNPGLGTLVEELISKELSTQSLFIHKTMKNSEPIKWISIVTQMKPETENLPVGLIRSASKELFVNPHPDFMVQPDDHLIYIGLYQENDVNSNIDLVYSEGADAYSPPSPEAEKLFKQGLELEKIAGKHKEAYRNFHKAAILHHHRAKYNLGIMNFNGHGVKKNYNEAYHWFQESAKYGHKLAKKALKSIKVLRDIEESSEEHDIPEFNQDLITNLNEEQILWFSSVVVSMIMADGHIDLHERSFLHSAIRLVKNKDKIMKLEEGILNWEIPAIEPIEFEKEDQDRVFSILLNIATVDRDFDEEEEKLLRKIADSMGMDKAQIDHLIKLGYKRIEQFRANQLRAPNVRARL